MLFLPLVACDIAPVDIFVRPLLALKYAIIKPMKYSVTVKPGSKIEKITEENGEIIVRTHAKAHDGEANKAVIEALAKHFGVAKTSIKITSGEKSKHKIVEI